MATSIEAEPDDRFDQQVPISIKKKAQMIHSARQAAEILLYKWPSERMSDKRLAAQRACLRTLQGRSDGRRARMAFEAAAKEAEILINAGLFARPARSRRNG